MTKVIVWEGKETEVEDIRPIIRQYMTMGVYCLSLKVEDGKFVARMGRIKDFKESK